MLLTPRDYQNHAIDATFDYFASTDEPGNPLILMPTGSGKSLVVAGICYKVLEWDAEARILMLTHVKELVQQNYDKLKAMWPEAPVGIYCAGLNRKHHHFPITFGSIGSVVDVTEIFGHIDILLVDEAQMISPSESTMYQRCIGKLAKKNPKLKVIGLTATGYRMKQGMLTEGDDAIFDDIIVDMTDLESYNWFFEEGYLVPPIPRPTKTGFDLSKVAIRGEEYDDKSLRAEVDTQKKNEAVVQELIEGGASRHAGLVFASGVDHVKHLAEIFEYNGESVTWVATNGITDKERDRRIEAYKDGQFKWMVNNGILTTGFDYPAIDIIGMVRHTLSVALWIQMLGRGTRPLYSLGYDLSDIHGRLSAIANSQKQNCMVYDFADNVTRLGHINAPRVPQPKERKRKGDAPIRICDNCGCYNHASARICWACGFVFPRYEKFDADASTKELVKKVNSGVPPVTPIELVTRKVDFVTYSIHKKTDKPDSLKANYHCGRRIHSEWICFDHGGYAGHKAKEWWEERFDGGQPDDTAHAHELAVGLRQPYEIIVEKVSGVIRDFKFTEQAADQNDSSAESGRTPNVDDKAATSSN